MAENTGQNNLYRGVWVVSIICIVVTVIFGIIFAINQTYRSDLPCDTAIFGTYGDFIGGVIGTFIAFISVFWLIKTFQNQSNINSDIEATNKSIVSANQSIIAANQKADAAAQKQFYQTELQLFDNKFRSFLDAYLKAVDSYETSDLKGRLAFEYIAKEFVESDFNNNSNYEKRCISATDDYLRFYACNQTLLSVHLRMLYLIINLISNSQLEEDDKVQYAKLVRGQMSNIEMLIVRYNCSSYYGVKMRQLCNEFNLIKHLPVTRLLEFKTYRRTIEDSGHDSEKLLNGLDAMLITLRKATTGMLYDGNEGNYEYKTSHSYKISLNTTTEKTTFTLELNKDKNASKGGGIRISPEERALDLLLGKSQVLPMFKDYLTELFTISNFKLYNNGADIQASSPTDNSKNFSFMIEVNSKKRLALSTIQKNNRDNQTVGLE